MAAPSITVDMGREIMERYLAGRTAPRPAIEEVVHAAVDVAALLQSGKDVPRENIQAVLRMCASMLMWEESKKQIAAIYDGRTHVIDAVRIVMGRSATRSISTLDVCEQFGYLTFGAVRRQLKEIAKEFPDHFEFIPPERLTLTADKLPDGFFVDGKSALKAVDIVPTPIAELDEAMAYYRDKIVTWKQGRRPNIKTLDDEWGLEA